MVQLPSAGPNEANAIETFARLSNTNSQTNIDQLHNRQLTTNSYTNSEYNRSSNNILLPDKQSNTIIHQVSIMEEEFKNFTKHVSSNIIKMTQAHNTTQEHTGKLIESAISQALYKTQDATASPPNTVNVSTRNINYAYYLKFLYYRINVIFSPMTSFCCLQVSFIRSCGKCSHH